MLEFLLLKKLKLVVRLHFFELEYHEFFEFEVVFRPGYQNFTKE